MDQSLTTSHNTSAALSPDDLATLQAARKMNSKAQPVSYDSIKLKDRENEVLGSDGQPLVRGDYFIESYDQSAKKKSFRDVGPNPEVVILHRCYTYSWYKEGEGL